MVFDIGVIVPGSEAESVGYSESLPAAIKFVEMLERSSYLTEKKCSFNVVPITKPEEIAWAYTMRLMCQAAPDHAQCFDIKDVWHIPISQIIESLEKRYS